MLKLSDEEILEILARPPFEIPLSENLAKEGSQILHFSAVNPSCGDRVEGDLEIENDYVSKIFLKHSGCTLSKVSSILWLQQINGKKVNEISTLPDDFIFSLIGEVIPLRHNCALLTSLAVKEIFLKKNLS